MALASMSQAERVVDFQEKIMPSAFIFQALTELSDPFLGMTMFDVKMKIAKKLYLDKVRGRVKVEVQDCGYTQQSPLKFDEVSLDVQRFAVKNDVERCALVGPLQTNAREWDTNNMKLVDTVIMQSMKQGEILFYDEMIGALWLGDALNASGITNNDTGDSLYSYYSQMTGFITLLIAKLSAEAGTPGIVDSAWNGVTLGDFDAEKQMTAILRSRPEFQTLIKNPNTARRARWHISNNVHNNYIEGLAKRGQNTTLYQSQVVNGELNSQFVFNGIPIAVYPQWDATLGADTNIAILVIDDNLYVGVDLSLGNPVYTKYYKTGDEPETSIGWSSEGAIGAQVGHANNYAMAY